MSLHLDNPSVWKWVSSLLVAFIIGNWTGQFTPNRNIVTTDQITRNQAQVAQQINGVQTSVVTLAATVQTLDNEVQELRGELRGKNLLAPNN